MSCDKDYLVWELPRTNVADSQKNANSEGETMVQITNDLNQIQFIDNNLAFIAGNRIVLKSTDAGGTWIKVKESVNVNFTALYFVNSSLGYLGGNDQYYSYVYKTTDGGLTWQEIADFWFQNEGTAVTGLFASGSGGSVVALINQYPNATQVYGHLYYSNDGGVNWGATAANRDPGFNAADMISGRILIGGNSDWTGSAYKTGVFETSYLLNGSAALSEYTVDNPIDFNDLDMVSGYGFGVADNGQLAISSDAGQNWTVRSVPGFSSVNFNAVVFASDATGYIGTNTGEILKTEDYGASWSSIYQLSDFISDMVILPNGTLFVVGKNGLLIDIN
jgi:photosystem II stability/assembly factor-like uncharacterized protein